MTSRRKFLATLGSAAAGAAAVTTLPRLLSAYSPYPAPGDPILRELSARALEAAQAAGATYADVKFTVTWNEGINAGSPGQWGMTENSRHAIAGVRVLADGAWGFAASSLWTPDELARLAREATVQARANAQGRQRKIELSPHVTAQTGEWRTPLVHDPLRVPIPERVDALWALVEIVSRLEYDGVDVSARAWVRMRRQEKTFASSAGSFLSQTLYYMDPLLGVNTSNGRTYASRRYDRLQPTTAGWEIFSDATLARDLPAFVDHVVESVRTEPTEPDRYDVVCDGLTTAQIVGRTLGVASELDRVLGYEANAGGTSYLAPPEDVVGKLKLAPDLLNVVADRSRPGSPATVKWDDEGIVPEDYPIVKDGVVVGYHTTRELAGAERSHGCAASDTAGDVTLCHPPNVTMLPGRTDNTLEEMIAGLERGLVILGGQVTIDRQQLNGEIRPEIIYEVRNGKRTKTFREAEILFRAPELWKSLQAVGGPRTQVWTGMTAYKGQPAQSHNFGVSAVAARFGRVAVTDRRRQA